MNQRLPSLPTPLVVLFSAGVAQASLTWPKIDRHPAPADWPWRQKPVNSIPRYDPNSTKPFEADLRSLNLAHLDLRDHRVELPQATFDDRTNWPENDRLPRGGPLLHRPTYTWISKRVNPPGTSNTWRGACIGFWTLALKTSQTIQLHHEGKTRGLGPVLAPERLIGALKDEAQDSTMIAFPGR